MAADTSRCGARVGEWDPADGRRRRGPTVPGTRSLTVIVTPSRVETTSTEEHKDRQQGKHNPPPEPDQQQDPAGLLTNRREDRHEVRNQHGDDDPGEPKPEPGPATQRAAKHAI